MYQRQAQGLASLGRGPDTELVHMTKNEVNALDDLAKGLGYAGLPTNPQTELPEAGIFDSILPILIGAGAAAAAPFTAGTSLAALGPLLANPLIVGGASALGAGIASGFDLSEMAKYGLGVASGSSLAGGLMGAGSGTAAAKTAGASAEQIAAETSRQAAEQAARKAAEEGAKSFAGGAAKGVLNPAQQADLLANAKQFYSLGAPQVAEVTGKTLPAGVAAGMPVLPGQAGGLEIARIASSTPFTTESLGRSQLGNISRAFSSTEGLTAIPKAVGTAPLLAGAGSLAADAYGQEYGFEPVEPKRSGFMPYPEGGFMPPERTSIDPFQGIVSPLSSEERLFFDPGPFTSPGFVEAKQGGMLTGLGDGMSDDIMLPIKGAEKGDPTIAAVSTDEFIVPADVVSGLGNGSSSAGAKQLYAMMDRVRDKRTGKESQPQEIKARKMLPA